MWLNFAFLFLSLLQIVLHVHSSCLTCFGYVAVVGCADFVVFLILYDMAWCIFADPEGIANAQKSLGLGQEEKVRKVR